jgi:hypothetical protein
MKPFLLVLPFLAACGDDPPRRGKHRGGPGDVTVSTATVNGLEAHAYYDQFTWQATGTYVVGAAGFPTAPDGRDTFLVHLYLMGDGGFVLFYEEGEGDVDYSGWSISTYTDSMRRREGTWTVDGAGLDVGGLVACNGMAMNGEELLSCTLASSIVTGEAVGASFWLEVDTFGPSAPSDSDWRDYRD